MPEINFDELVKRSVQKNFDYDLTYFIGEGATGFEGIVVVEQDLEVDDESGRRYFMWGVSTWGGPDIVKE